MCLFVWSCLSLIMLVILIWKKQFFMAKFNIFCKKLEKSCYLLLLFYKRICCFEIERVCVVSTPHKWHDMSFGFVFFFFIELIFWDDFYCLYPKMFICFMLFFLNILRYCNEFDVFFCVCLFAQENLNKKIDLQDKKNVGAELWFLFFVFFVRINY